jgi:hypothetical protein
MWRKIWIRDIEGILMHKHCKTVYCANAYHYILLGIIDKWKISNKC